MEEYEELLSLIKKMRTNFEEKYGSMLSDIEARIRGMVWGDSVLISLGKYQEMRLMLNNWLHSVYKILDSLEKDVLSNSISEESQNKLSKLKCLLDACPVYKKVKKLEEVESLTELEYFRKGELNKIDVIELYIFMIENFYRRKKADIEKRFEENRKRVDVDNYYADLRSTLLNKMNVLTSWHGTTMGLAIQIQDILKEEFPKDCSDKFFELECAMLRRG